MKSYAATLVFSFYVKKLWDSRPAEVNYFASYVAKCVMAVGGVHFTVGQCRSGFTGNAVTAPSYIVYASSPERGALTAAMTTLVKELKSSNKFEVVFVDLHINEVDVVNLD